MSIKSSRPRGLDKLEGTGASQLVQLIQHFGYNKDVDIEIATVTSPPPALRIKIDNMPVELEADDLVVAEHLTRHTRIVTIRHSAGMPRDLGDTTGTDSVLVDGMTPGYSTFDYDFVELTFEDVLKPGDRVIVASINDDQTYVILDRAVTY